MSGVGQSGELVGRRSVLLVAVLTLGLTACVPEDLGGAFIIVNDWDQPVFFATARIAPNGGRYTHGLRGCGRPGLELYDKAGGVAVRLEKWCSGQVLTIRSPDDFTLESATG